MLLTLRLCLKHIKPVCAEAFTTYRAYTATMRRNVCVCVYAGLFLYAYFIIILVDTQSRAILLTPFPSNLDLDGSFSTVFDWMTYELEVNTTQSTAAARFRKYIFDKVYVFVYQSDKRLTEICVGTHKNKTTNKQSTQKTKTSNKSQTRTS